MYQRIINLFVIISITATTTITAQETNKNTGVHLTTGIGINKIQGELGNTFRSTVAFNSGFEKGFGHNWFGQLEVNFNTLKYDQRFRDENSQYLFQNTNSSLFMVGVNVGKDFHFGTSRWFVSPYLGSGYINIGEPRLDLHAPTGIIKQEVIRKSGLIGKAGGRIGFNTKTKLLQTLYLDGSYWTSSLKVNDLSLRSISVFIGIRMTM